MAISGTALGAASTSDVREVLLDLLDHTSDDPAGVLSIYVDLDPSTFATPPARARELTSLVDAARREAPGTDWHEPIERLRAEFEAADHHVLGARGVACFCDAAGSMFELVLLADSAPRMVTWGRAPYLRPLVSTLPRGEWLVLLVNRREARLLHGTREQLDLVEELSDDVPGQHATGGWSQANYERSIEQEVDEHLRRVAELVARHVDEHELDGVLVATPSELRPRLHGELPARVADLVRGHLSLDVEHVSSQDLHAATRAAIDEHELRRRELLLERLHANAGIGDRAAIGLEATLAALVERSVETLLVPSSLRVRGDVCPSCGWMRPGSDEVDGACPIDSSPLTRVDDIVEAAIESAVLQDAHVVTFDAADDRVPELDSLSALLRH